MLSMGCRRISDPASRPRLPPGPLASLVQIALRGRIIPDGVAPAQAVCGVRLRSTWVLTDFQPVPPLNLGAIASSSGKRSGALSETDPALGARPGLRRRPGSGIRDTRPVTTGKGQSGRAAICLDRRFHRMADLSDELWCCKRGLNSRPLPYQGSALPLSYKSDYPSMERETRIELATCSLEGCRSTN